MKKRAIEPESTTISVTYNHSAKIFTVDLKDAEEVPMSEIPDVIRTGLLRPQVVVFYYKTNPCYIYYVVNGVLKRKVVPCS
jgi:hypothetical protein